MSILDKLRGIFASPERIDDGGGDSEVSADLHAEYGTPDEGGEDVERMAEGEVGGGYIPDEDLAGRESAETAEEDLETEEAPPDPDP